MKKLFLFPFLSLFIISCSNDSVSDISEDPNTNETPKEENNNTKLTFTNDISPIIINKCGTCHLSGGGETNYSIYTLAKNNATTIQNRINLTQSSNGFMPQGRNKLSTSDLAKFNQWIADGKLE